MTPAAWTGPTQAVRGVRLSAARAARSPVAIGGRSSIADEGIPASSQLQAAPRVNFTFWYYIPI